MTREEIAEALETLILEKIKIQPRRVKEVCASIDMDVRDAVRRLIEKSIIYPDKDWNLQEYVLEENE